MPHSNASTDSIPKSRGVGGSTTRVVLPKETSPTIRKAKSGRPFLAEEDYVEHQALFLPTIKNGPVALGDMWNCRTNTVEGNLFDQPLGAFYLSADPIQNMDYKFQRCFSTKDVNEILKISAQLKLEVAGWKIEGKGSFDETNTSKFHEENIVFSYDCQTYQVRVRPTASAVISKAVRKCLEEDIIVATHFVQAITLGGQATGQLKFHEITNNSKLHITGSFKLSGKVGSVTIEAQAEFEKLDETKDTTHSVSIQVNCQPRFKTAPTTCKEMFEEIPKVIEYMEAEQHFPELDKINDKGEKLAVVGVPLGFRLVPLAHIMVELDEEDPVDPIQKELSEKTKTEYGEMFEVLRDFSRRDQLKKLLAEMSPAIVPILLDDFNPLTINLRARQGVLMEIAHTVFMDSSRLYDLQKIQGEHNEDWCPVEGGVRHVVREECLVNFLTLEYGRKFNIVNLYDELLGFRERMKKQLVGIRAADVDGIVDEEGLPAINFFTNLTDLLDWWVQEKTHKILMKTDITEEAPNGVFLKLYALAPLLKKHGVEVGVALPNISYKHLFSKGQPEEDPNALELSLTFKTQYATDVYYGYDMRFFLELLEVAVDKGDSVAKNFYSLNCALSGLRLPMEEFLFDIPNLFIVMRQYVHEAREEGRGKTVVCETYCGLLARLAESYDTWNFVFPVEATYTSVEMMRFYRQLRVYVRERFPNLKHQFLIAAFTNVSDMFYSPNLLLFKDDVLQAVCLDQLDILLMMEQFGMEKPNWDLLSFRRMRESCLYTKRADWAIRVVPNLILDHQTYLSDPIPPLDEFPDYECTYLPSAITVARVAALRDEPLVLTTLAHLALAEVEVPSALEEVLQRYGYRDNGFHLKDFYRQEWGKLATDLKDYLENEAPWLMKVVMAHRTLKEIDPEKGPGSTEDAKKPWVDSELVAHIRKIIAFLDVPGLAYRWHGRLVEEDDFYKDLRVEVARYDGSLGSIMLMGITRTFEMFIAQETKREEIFHLYNMIALAEGLGHETLLSLKHVLVPMTERYCARVLTEHTHHEDGSIHGGEEAMDLMYPRVARRIADSLRERQLFKTVGILSEMAVNHKLFILQQEFFNMYYLPSPTNVQSMVEKMTLLRFDEDQLEVVWTNPKFLYVLRQVLHSEAVLDTLIVLVFALQKKRPLPGEELPEEEDDVGEEPDPEGRNTGDDDDDEIVFPYWMPDDVVEKVRELIAIREKIEFPYEKDWITVDVMIGALKAIYVRKSLPSSFPEGVRSNMAGKEVVSNALKGIDVELYWDEAYQLFNVPWSITTLSRVLYALMPNNLKTLSIMPADSHFGDFPGNARLAAIKSKEMRTAGVIKLNRAWARLTKHGVLEEITYLSYIQLDSLNPKAKTEYDELYDAAGITLRFLLQRGKMMEGASLKAGEFENYIRYPPLRRMPGQIDFGEGIPPSSLGFFMSRGDVQTALCHVADPTVTYSLLSTMAKTPVAIPLLVTSIEEGPEDDGLPHKTVLMLEALKDVIVPEMVGLVPQPRLFKEPFRFILTLRLGETKELPGRASFINRHLMKDTTFYSSRQDPGSPNGKPMNRNGFLEFGWLSETTTNREFWDIVRPEYEDERRKHMILLGMLHGDALGLASVFEYILPYVSAIVVFWKVKNITELRTRQKDLSTAIKPFSIKTSHMVLYPDATVAGEVPEDSWLLEPKEGSPNDILNKKRLLDVMHLSLTYAVNEIPRHVVEGLSDPPGSASSTFFSTIKSGLSGVPLKGQKTTTPVSTSMPIAVEVKKPVGTLASRALIAFIEKTAIVNIQSAIRWPDREPDHATILAQLTELFIDLITLTEAERERGLTHFTWELDLLSSSASKEPRDRIEKLRDLIQAKYYEENGHLEERWTLETQQEMKMSMEAYRTNTLSVMDLWRLLWNYNITSKETRRSLLSLNSDYLKAGFPVEMFHYSYNEVPWKDEVGEALKSIDPETRILIVSAFGAKNSGKSTLLNSLFGAGFTMGGSTYGLQLRLVYLNNELKEATDTDAFIIIDSEGVIGAENKIDPQAHAFERRVVSFLLGISSVSLATVVGGTMGELSSVLEIGFTSLEKLGELAPLTPDLYVVQNLSQGQTGRESVPKEINSAIISAVEVTSELPLQAGLLTTEAHRLKMFKSRNRHAEIVHPVSARTSMVEQDDSFVISHADIQSLYAKIIHAAATSRDRRIKLGEWIESTTQLWGDIQSLEVPFVFPTVPQLRAGLTLEDRISNVKRAIEAAFRYHEKKLEIDFVNGTNDSDPPLDDVFNLEFNASFEGLLFNKFNKLLKGLNKVINACDDKASQEASRISKRKGILRRLRTAQTNPDACFACATAFKVREELFVDVSEMERGFLIEEGIILHATRTKDAVYNRLHQGILARKLRERKSAPGSLLDSMVEKIEAIVEGTDEDEEQWTQFFQYVSTLQSVIPTRLSFHNDLEEVYKSLPHVIKEHNPDEELDALRPRLPAIKDMVAFDVQIYNSALESSMNVEKPETMSWVQYEWLVAKLEDMPRKMKEDAEAVLYKVGMAGELQKRVEKLIALFEEYCGEPLTLGFRWTVHIYAILLFSLYIGEQQAGWDLRMVGDENGDKSLRDGNNPLMVIKEMRNVVPDLKTYFNKPTRDAMGTQEMQICTGMLDSRGRRRY